MVSTKPFLMDRRNALFLRGIGAPSVGPEAARLLHCPRRALQLLLGGHPIRGTITFVNGIFQLLLLAVVGLALFGFLLGLSLWMAGMFLVLVEAGRGMAGFGPASEAVYLPVLAAVWMIALALNSIWATAGIRRALPKIATGLRLAKARTVLPGQVVSCVSSSYLHFNGWAEEVCGSFVMKYTFVTPAGETLSASILEPPARASKGWNPQPGDPLAILYADDENFQAL